MKKLSVSASPNLICKKKLYRIFIFYNLMACYMQTNKKQNTREEKNAKRMVNKNSHRPHVSLTTLNIRKKKEKGII